MTFEFETTDLCDDDPEAVGVREPLLRSFGAKRRAPLGDMLAGIAVERDLGRVAVNGCVRDLSGIEALDVGALAANPLKSRQEGAGETGVEVESGGLTWGPGEDICADEDGVATSRKPLP